MKYQYLGVSIMSFISGLILSYIYFSVHNLRADMKEVSQLKSQMLKRASAATSDVSKSNGLLASEGIKRGKLQPPKFADRIPTSLKMWAHSELKVEWKPVAGANGYDVYIETKDGKNVRKFQTKNTFVKLHDLPVPKNQHFADYNIRLATKNGVDEIGDKGEPIKLAVGREDHARPPTIKSIVVQD